MQLLGIIIFLLMNITTFAFASSNIEQGDAALAGHNITKAIQHYQIELKNNPKSIIARTKLAECYMRKGYTAASLKVIDEAITLSPNDVDPLFLKSKLYIRGKRLDEAAQTLNQLLVLSPEHIEAHVQLARIYNEQGNAEAADALYLKIDAMEASK